MTKRKNRKAAVKKTQRTGSSLIANRKYKDTVFRLLFKDKSNLLSLFNAVNDTDFSDENDIKITTLENTVFYYSLIHIL